MSGELDVIIVDDDHGMCEVLSSMLRTFYEWGEIITFENVDEAISYCLSREVGVGIFIVDVYLEDQSGFTFLDTIKDRFPVAHEDCIIITGDASKEVVDRCISSDVTYLLEKPIRQYALQLAVRAIVMKYMKFAKRLMQDSALAANVASF